MTNLPRMKRKPQKLTSKKLLERMDTPESRFMLAGIAMREKRGGWPTCSVENGAIVFTYPDGTRTSGGRTLPSVQVG